MIKYEIMLILDPISDIQIIKDICNKIFKSKNLNIIKLENTELAYKINKSKIAIYILINVLSTSEEITEFIRKCNITKGIWRQMVVNLDSEKGLNRKANPKKIKKPFIKKFFQKRSENAIEEQNTEISKKLYINKQKDILGKI